jgi:hypothetical protein
MLLRKIVTLIYEFYLINFCRRSKSEGAAGLAHARQVFWMHIRLHEGKTQRPSAGAAAATSRLDWWSLEVAGGVAGQGCMPPGC